MKLKHASYATLTPPGRHQSQQPLISTGQIFEEHRRVQDQISSSPKGAQANKQTQCDPGGRGTGNNGEHGRDEQRHVKGKAASNYVRRKPPEDGAHQHAHIDGNGETSRVSRVKLFLGLGGDDGLNQQNQRVHGVTEAVETEQFPMMGRESDLINGLNAAQKLLKLV